MNIVESNGMFRIYGEGLKTHSKLPSGVFELNFDKMSGFYLSRGSDPAILEDKIYGVAETKVEKCIKAFELCDRNLGILLSGRQGSGKTLFAKLLAKEVLKKEIPVITISEYYSGLTTFINSIDQEVLVLFDEFEKVFPYDPDDEKGCQEELLTLFDGFYTGKKLFVLICNDLGKINPYLLDRPGRVYYHFKFESPSCEEIKEYLYNNISPEYQDSIEELLTRIQFVPCTYDILRAIVFEINSGFGISETFEDLNIRNDKTIRCDLVVTLTDNTVLKTSTKPSHLSYPTDTAYLCKESNKIDEPYGFTLRYDTSSAKLIPDKGMEFDASTAVITVDKAEYKNESDFNEDKELVSNTRIKTIFLVPQTSNKSLCSYSS